MHPVDNRLCGNAIVIFIIVNYRIGSWRGGDNPRGVNLPVCGSMRVLKGCAATVNNLCVIFCKFLSKHKAGTLCAVYDFHNFNNRRVLREIRHIADGCLCIGMFIKQEGKFDQGSIHPRYNGLEYSAAAAFSQFTHGDFCASQSAAWRLHNTARHINVGAIRGFNGNGALYWQRSIAFTVAHSVSQRVDTRSGRHFARNSNVCCQVAFTCIPRSGAWKSW